MLLPFFLIAFIKIIVQSFFFSFFALLVAASDLYFKKRFCCLNVAVNVTIKGMNIFNWVIVTLNQRVQLQAAAAVFILNGAIYRSFTEYVTVSGCIVGLQGFCAF